MFLLFFSTNSGVAQTLEVPWNQDINANAQTLSGVRNTGADFIEDDADYTKVMEFDGDTPQFAWDYCGNTGIDEFADEDLTDPDVILTNDWQFALVCYESNGQIYLSVWEWDGGTNYVETQATLGNYTFPYAIENGTNPNIDIEFYDYFVITWEDDDGQIKGLAGQYQGSQTFDIAANPALIDDDLCRDPDVTIYRDTVTFTYIVLDDSGDDWVTIQEAYSDVYNNSTVGTPVVMYTSNPSLEGSFGRPRIASPVDLNNPAYFDQLDYTTVIDYYWEDGDNAFWDILAKQNNLHNLSSAWVVNPDINTLVNKEPVITYSGDAGIIAWTANVDYPGQPVYYSYEVLTRQFAAYWWTPGPPYITTYASIVNYDYYLIQDIPSVAGRRPGGNVFYFYKNGSTNTDDMMYRTAGVNTQNLRLKNEQIGNLGTEQTTDDFEITITEGILKISTDNTLYTYYITDITGRVIYKNSKASFENEINLSTLPRGIYIINCYSPDQNQVYKFLK